MEQVRLRYEAFQRLSPEEKLREFRAVIARGWAEIMSSPDREAILRRMDEEEERGKQVHRDLIAQYYAPADVPLIIFLDKPA